ncbi:glycosyl transferase family 2 [Thermotoga maritima MSB8]|uniref:glycosyltransferase family 2 protein n=1 Tax=Thermotoga maritima TaxID=2336 RepID=UPI00022D8B29|nr:glycosyltransferase family A protein [Thermotoga maritima]AGL50211.1 4,4-diaponeurosporenoate glycosyltransferase [Thermotoga maritima MSB8]AKE27191.1 glycosyl transferase family 2 [Thermotoga maritima]AKE29056.1 glycosyl transferase family 2 [Thermotoga maritima MSB8]AKE30928.1 glycosyl transferase family 2 [Thermotoga maritima]
MEPNLLHIVIVFSSLLISLLYFFFSRKRFLHTNGFSKEPVGKISVIIPARNEEKNIGKILKLLSIQRVKPHEVIVVDDNSTDRTSAVAENFKDAFERFILIRLTKDPPKNWVGKTWAIWNGYQNSSGEILIFMDADVEPEEGAIEVLVEIHKKHPGLISVWPYQRFERFYEHLNLVFNLMIVYASNMLGFPSKRPKGAFGPVILTSRRDYMKTGGHAAIKDSVLEDHKKRDQGDEFLRKWDYKVQNVSRRVQTTV